MPKECKNKQCQFNEKYPNGCPDDENFCSKCASELQVKVMDPNPDLDPDHDQPSSSDTLKDLEISIEKRLSSSMLYEYPTIEFITIMMTSDFNSIKGHLTIRFRNPDLGSFINEVVLLNPEEGIIEFENVLFVILKGSLKIPPAILQNLDTELTFGIAYKYFLAEKEERLPWFEGKFERCLYLSNHYLGKKPYRKYDIMPIYNCSQEKYIHDDFWIWRLSFGVLASSLSLNFTKHSSTFEDEVASFTSMTKRIFSARYIKQSDSINREFVSHALCLSFDLATKESKIRAKWFLDELSSVTTSQGYLKYLFLILLVNHNKELGNIEKSVFKKLFTCMKSNHIESLIMTKVHSSFIGKLHNQRKSLQSLQESFNATLFNVDISDTTAIIKILPLYHCLFDFQKQFAKQHKHHNFANNEYWGFPPNVTTNKFYREMSMQSMDSFLNHFVIYDHIIPYSIVLLTLNTENIDQLSTFTSVPIVSFVAVIIYRIKNWSCSVADSTLRNHAFEIILSKLNYKDYVNILEADELCDTLFILWEFTEGDNFSEHLFITPGEVLLHLRLTAKLLQMYDENHHNILEKYDCSLQPCKNLKTSEELLNIILKLLPSILRFRNSEFKTIHEKLEFWKDLFELQFPKSYKWSGAVEKYFKISIQHICCENTTDILVEMSREDRFHTKMISAFKDKVIRYMAYNQNSVELENILQKLENLSRNHFAELMEILNTILGQQMEVFKQNSILHLLTWQPWSIIFKLHMDENMENPQKDSQIVIEEAKKEFFTVVDKLRNVQIPIRILRLINANLAFFIKIYKSLDNHWIHIGNLEESIKELTDTLQYFDTQFEFINNFHYILNHANYLFECLEVKDFFRIDFESQPLKEVCRKDFDSEEYCLIPNSLLANKLNTAKAKNIFKMSSHLRGSLLFINIFKQFIFTKYEFNQSKLVEIETIYEDLWLPALLECENLIKDLFTESISLSNVEEHFRLYQSAEENMCGDINNFCCALGGIRNDFTFSPDLIRNSARHVIQFFKLHEACELASSISQVRNKYCQEGNFHEIDLLIKLKNTHFTAQNQLKIITRELIHLSSQLDRYDSYAKQLLDAFIYHTNFINWARVTLEDREQLKVFVDLALASCGETDFDITRVTCLRSVCSYLAPLIFDLQSKSDCKEFLALYEGVLKQKVEKDKFIDTFDEAANLLHVWRHMAIAHTSVGKSAIGELTEILEKGIFQIKVDSDYHQGEELITLFLNDSSMLNFKYNLDYLKDLQGKLALITAESKKIQGIELFTFLLENITELSFIISKLKRIGHISYTNFFREYTCTSENISKLTRDISIGNKEFAEWSETLEKARRQYNALNFYTATQIYILRRDLRYGLCEGPQIIHILSILQQNITVESIKETLDKISNDIASFPKISDEADLPIEQFQGIEKGLLEQFPPAFSPQDKDLCFSLREQDVDMSMSIFGIQHFKRERDSYDEVEILEFCLNNSEQIEFERNTKVTKSEAKEITISENQENNENFLPLEVLSRFLEEIRTHLPKISRQLPQTCKKGEPNLLFIPNNEMIYFVLSQYLDPETNYPFPNNQEVLICNQKTLDEEIDIFMRRTMWNSNSIYLFSLIFIEKLQYEVAVKCVSRLKLYTNSTKCPDFKLLLICSSEFENSSYFTSSLFKYKRISPSTFDDDQLKIAILRNFCLQKDANQDIRSKSKPACLIDPDKSNVRVVTSDSVGAGKSLAIDRFISELKQMQNLSEDVVCSMCIPIHCGYMDENDVLKYLKASDSEQRDVSWIYHFDIASTIREEIIPLLFKLLILGCIKDQNGHLWVCKKTDYYIIEMTLIPPNQQLHRFLTLLPKTICLQPNSALVKMKSNTTYVNEITIDMEEFHSFCFQRVYTYLKKKESKFSLENFEYSEENSFKGGPIAFLEIVLRTCGINNPSWSELCYFLRFLNQQLFVCEQNIYCRSSQMDKSWKGFKTFLINRMIPMSRDISTPSLINSLEASPFDILHGYKIEPRRRWEEKSQPYVFLNEDRQTMTFFGFRITKSLDLIDVFNSSKVIEKSTISRQLYLTLLHNLVDLDENCQNWNKEKKIDVLANVMGIIKLDPDKPNTLIPIEDPDPTYVLTIDNMKKILAIHMRFRCNIPVIIMGETGCGKTRLIYYMCQLQSKHLNRKNIRVLKIHGGTSNDDIIRELNNSIELAKTNVSHNIDTILFFDEANTSHSIGLIKEILCDRRVNGKPIPNDVRLQFIAACNPYRRHSEQMRQKIYSLGLGSFNSNEGVREMFGNIPLRELVYRVVEMPKSLLPLVWDFGQLNSDVEKSYIREIILKHLQSCSFPLRKSLVNRLTEVLSVIQGYMRTREDECSHVSLRDVERVMRVMLWFYDNIHIFSIDFDLDKLTTSFLLSLAICYRARLRYRRTFDATLILHFQDPLNELKNEYIIENEIEKCQTAITDSMKIDDHIAKNYALSENLFLMFVCIELRIPIFIIGKPGSSKSLAKTIISHSMDGEGSREDSKLKNFKQLHILSYQCSQLSTSDGILNLFITCQKIQSREDPKRFVACVVLDEVGLAEDSPSLPLKVLHPLLEDDSPYLDETINCEKVAFIGLSNWALDPAKMNRGIMVCLEDPNQDELILSARAICQSKNRSDIHSQKILPFIKELVESYLELIKFQREKYRLEYFGLRDFYSLIKMLYHICMKEDSPINKTILFHAVKRNFGGLKDLNAFAIFEKHLHLRADSEKGPGSTPLELISSNLSSHQGTFYQKTRYLLLITENNAALDIIKQSNLVDTKDLRIIFGSSFPNDLEYSTICRSINKIKNYMETGKTVILTNMLNLYESLYDVLNQYYLESLQRSWVDIGLGTHRVKCAVHEDFKLIVLANHFTVYTKFPSALINRLEKHILTISTILSEEELKMANEIKSYATKFAEVNTGINKNKGTYVTGDCFVGFQEDSSSFIIYSNLNNLQELTPQQSSKAIIMENSYTTLFKMATPDSMLRLNNTMLVEEANSILQRYLSLPLQNLVVYLQSIIVNKNSFSQVTTHSIVLMESEAIEIEESLAPLEYSVSVHVLYLLQFQTSQQFMSRIRELMTKSIDRGKIVLLIQCENGHEHTDLIACTRHRIMEEFTVMEGKFTSTSNIYVVIIVRLPRNTYSFTSFCGSNWDTVHIDELRPPDFTILPPFHDLIHLSLSEIFAGKTSIQGSKIQKSKFNQSVRLLETLQSALSLLIERKGSQVRTLKRIKQFMILLHNESFQDISSKICKIISELLDNKNVPIYSKEWSKNAAFQDHLIQSAGTFRKALSKEIDRAIIPLLAETLAYLDRNGNIDLVFSKNNSAITELWNCIFIDEFLLFHHSQAINPVISDRKMKVQVISDGWNGNFFQCRFPFSWIIVRSINELLNKIKIHSGRSEILTNFETAFNQTPIGVSINLIMEKYSDTFIPSLYLDDFINLVIYPRNEIEHKAHFILFLNTVLKLRRLHCGNDFAETSPKETRDVSSSLLSIPMIHVAYEMLISRISFIKQSYGLKFRGQEEIEAMIFESTKNDKFGKLGEKIDSLIFESMIAECRPNLGNISTKSDWDMWYLKVRQFQPLIETNINVIFSNPQKIQSIKRSWNVIQTILIFVANFVLQSEYDMNAYLRQINTMVYSPNTKFDSPDILKRIFMVLNALTKKVNTEISTQLNITCIKCNRHPADVIPLACLHYRCRNCLPDIKPEAKCPDCEDDIYASVNVTEREKHTNKCREMLSTQKAFRKISTNFIMEFLSSIIFASSDTSTDDKGLIDYLIGYIALDENTLETLPDFEVDDISLFKEGILKPSATVRLFLLQLLIKNRFHSLRNKLSEYMDLTLRQVNRSQESTGHEMIVLFVQCFEDYFHSKYFSLPTKALRIEYLSSYMIPDRINDIFEPLMVSETLSPAYIECISILRFVSLTICSWIFQKYDIEREALYIFLDYEKSADQIEQMKAQIPNEFKILLGMFKNLCLSVTCSQHIKTFIIKSFYSHWGWGGMKLILTLEEFSWLLPPDESKQTNMYIPLDLFAAFGADYQEARKAVHYLLNQDDVNSLIEYIDYQKVKKNMRIKLHRYIIFAVFTEGYLQYLRSDSSRLYIVHYKIENLSRILDSNLGTMPAALSILMSQLLNNSLFNKHINELVLSPNSHGYIATIASIFCHIGVLLHHALGEEKENFLSPLSLIYSHPRKVSLKLFPTMENTYSSSSEESITEDGKWYTCLNGHPYFIDEGEKTFALYNCSECGVPIGGISNPLQAPKAGTKQGTGHILGNPLKRQQIKVGVRRLSATSVSIIRALMHAIFSWATCVRFSNNLDLLMELTEDVGEMKLSSFYFLHLFIDILDISASSGKNFEEAALIVHLVIDKIINSDENIVSINTVFTSCLHRESWEFFFDKYFISPILANLDSMLEEKMMLVRNDVRIVNNPILRSLYEKDSTLSHSEANLWRYRNIICFQHFKKTFNSQGLEKSVRFPLLAKFIQEEHILSATRFLPEIVGLQHKLSQRKCLRLYEKMGADNTIQHFLEKIRKEEGEKAIEEYDYLINGFASAWSLVGNEIINQLGVGMKFQELCMDETPISLLLPNSLGDTSIIEAMTKLLVNCHNSIIEEQKLCSFLPNNEVTRNDNINLNNISSNTLINYHQQLDKLIISNARYSLQFGEGTRIEYDYMTIERQLVDRFISSKPFIINLSRPNSAREDNSRANFQRIKELIPQETIGEDMSRKILTELQTIERISEVLDLLEVVMGFAGSAGAFKNNKIQNYLQDVLRYPTGQNLLSDTANLNCCMKHLVSFWRILSVARAIIFVQHNQHPFSSFPDHLYRQLNMDQIKEFNNNLNLLPLFDILYQLHDFIFFFLKSYDSVQADYPLYDCYKIYFKAEHNKDPDNFPPKIFSKDILVSHAIHVWAILAQET